MISASALNSCTAQLLLNGPNQCVDAAWARFRRWQRCARPSAKKGERQCPTYLVGRNPYLENLHDQVHHIKYESLDHFLVKEVCLIIETKTRNPEHEKHFGWLARVDRAIQDVSTYDTNMSGIAHGNNFRHLPTELMLGMLNLSRPILIQYCHDL
jgi:hypothetical protein